MVAWFEYSGNTLKVFQKQRMGFKKKICECQVSGQVCECQFSDENDLLMAEVRAKLIEWFKLLERKLTQPLIVNKVQR